MKIELDHFELQEMAGLLCGLTQTQTEDIMNGDEDFDTPLLEKLDVDFEQFSNVVNALLSGNKLNLGLSPLTGRVYLGLQSESMFIGHKRDITSDFIQIMEQKFPLDTAQTINVGGENKFRFLTLSLDKEVVINGKKQFEKDSN